ncbi:MAG: mechanosensitive ion channel family protein [Pseudoalteromonas sp.]|uniref:mechanosensitive ion channel family protein n=1 Tax=unclassified Pseudoalteromonas TaxID=194690 RepID=UPI003F9A418C
MQYSHLYINQNIKRLIENENISTRNDAWQFLWPDLEQQVMQFLQAAWQMLPALLLGVVVIIGCYFLARPLSKIIIKPLGYMSESHLLNLVARRFVSILIIFFGIYIFLRLVGLTQFAVAVMSGTGLLGLILGFAFRDIAENFISSMLLSVQRPFKIDDVIEVNNHLGVVKKVTARATTLVDFDGNHIQIPNATVYKNVIKNLTANPKMRGHFVLGVGFDNDVRAVQNRALEIIKAQSAIIDDPAPQVLVDNLGAATINLTIYFWVNSEQHSTIKVASQLMRTLVTDFIEQGISMPDDARERILLNSQGDDLYLPTATQPETGVPQAQQKNQPVSEKPKINKSYNNQRHNLDDVSSDVDEIREQADQARDPEQGSNII